MSLRALLLLPLLATACGDKDDDSPPETGDDTSAAGTVMVFPSGDSTWTGVGDLAGAAVDATLELTRSGGELEGVMRFTLSGTELGIRLVGTIDDQSGQFVLVPRGWSGQASILDLVGISGVYDPASSSITGVIRDTQSWDSNDVEGGPFSATSTTPPDEVELASITAEPRITSAGVSFSGRSQCTASARPAEGTLTRGDDGQLTGTLSFSEVNGRFVGTFGLVGVEDATTGLLTLAPTPWIVEETDDSNYANYFVHGSLDGDSYDATVFLHANTSCPRGGFQVTLE